MPEVDNRGQASENRFGKASIIGATAEGKKWSKEVIAGYEVMIEGDDAIVTREQIS